ncbi:unnamed protein product [Allacma fusca]|uniref:Glycoside hydrolase family 38 central domain-containing protein n=2 Tax=Allacma fusca TaxID=39272 RepID=A0A8J2M9U7_9HEXA|nr:unnamed protein product [Allacma fusca]
MAAAFSIRSVIILFWAIHNFAAGVSDDLCPATLKGRLFEAPADYKTFQIKEAVSLVSGNNKTIKSIRDAGNTTDNKYDYSGRAWSATNKLKVFVLPHSHNDAGWGWTFESYYSSRTKYILDYMVHYMSEDSDLKLVWAEICFFDRWWRQQNEGTRNKVRRLIENKQLEFVGGGWVMPDEASVHYSSYVTQLLEGHQWLKQRFNYTPTNGWTIDPFGLSPTFSLLSKKSGIKSLTYLRIHYAIKTFLAERRSLEFIWRQFWDQTGRTDVFSHVMPYDSYDTASTCGPDHQICSDLSLELLGEMSFNDSNASYLHKKSADLVEQLRSKSTLFNTNNILYPLGGDFRYRTNIEWTQGLPHMKKIVQYINSHEDFFMEMKIVTLEEYMAAIEEDISRKKYEPKTLMGDFFTYDDKNNDYWSGYFTSRIFHKATERQLLALTRTAQTAFTLMTAEVYRFFGTISFNFIQGLLEKVIETRRALSLFQHHDGITGTSADYVVVDFARKLDGAIQNANFVIQQCLFILTNPENFLSKTKSRLLGKIKKEDEFLKPMSHRNKHNELWSRQVINVNESNPLETISVVNSLPTSRVQLVRVVVSHTKVKVTCSKGNEIPVEIFPTYELKYKAENDNFGSWRKYRKGSSLEMSNNYYELVFRVKLDPLAIQNYRIVYSSKSSKSETTVIKPKEWSTATLGENEDYQAGTLNKNIQIGNKNLSLTFGPDGVLKFVTMNDVLIPLKFSFLAYSTKSSGLYLFLPTGEAKPVELKSPRIIVVEGKLQSYVQIVYEHIIHRFILTPDLGIGSNSIEVENIIDIREKQNYELIMRVSTEIQNEDIFYTDSNGYQMMRRKRLPSNPIQGNYYPVATSAFIEDSNLRMTMLTAQPGGGSSLKSGDFEIMLDRIINQDDYRGIGQGGTDNLVVLSRVQILLEKPICSSEEGSNAGKVPALSLQASHELDQLLNPLVVYIQTSKKPWEAIDYKISQSKLIPCDIKIVGTFPLPEYDPLYDNDINSLTQSYRPTPGFGLVVNRISFDERFAYSQLRDTCDISESSMGKLKVTDLFGDLLKDMMQEMSLTFVKQEKMLNANETIQLAPMDIYSYLAAFNNSVQISSDGIIHESSYMNVAEFSLLSRKTHDFFTTM